MAVAANSRAMSRSRSKGEGAAHRRGFGEITRDLLIDRGMVTAIGNPDWPALAEQLGDISYESLRKALTNERMASVKIMESVAGVLGIDPSIYWEYRLAQAQRSFDPKEVGEDEAYANLLKWLGE